MPDVTGMVIDDDAAGDPIARVQSRDPRLGHPVHVCAEALVRPIRRHGRIEHLDQPHLPGALSPRRDRQVPVADVIHLLRDLRVRDVQPDLVDLAAT